MRKSFALILLMVLFLPLAAVLAEPARPNILFFFADDQRADTIAALGNRVIQTPHLDRLAKRGIVYERAYMQGGMNGATCVPSRAMLLSGRSLFHIDEKLQQHTTWPEAFRKAGYATFVSGKWHNGEASLARVFPNARAMFTGGMTNPLQAKLRHVEAGKVGEAFANPKHACETFADEAIQFIQAQHTAPFFAYVPFDGPHDPHIVPEDFPIQYAADQIPLPANFLPQHPFNNGEMNIRDEVLLPWPRTETAVKQQLADYYRYVSYLDLQIGRVLAALEKSPHANNTIVVFSADSGVARGSHGLNGKQNLYEHSLRVPLIIAGPGIAQGARSQAMCYLYDLLPSLGKQCQVPAPETSEGRDFSDTFRDPAQPGRTQMLFAYRKIQRALRDDRWKLIRYPQVNQTQLFDLLEDPYETKNLAALPEHAARVQAMLAQLAKEMTAAGDEQPLVVSDPQPAEWNPPMKKKSRS
jgi:arylsulfatase A-like enzyme